VITWLRFGYSDAGRLQGRDPEMWVGFTNAVYGTGASLQQVGPTSASASNMFYRVLLVN